MTRKAPPLTLTLGHLPAPFKPLAIDIFLHGFHPKIEHLMLRPKSWDQARRVYLDGADFSSALYAFSGNTLVGVLGIHHQETRFIHLHFPTLKKEFGIMGGVIRKLTGSVFKDLHPLARNEMRVQAIAVSPEARGQGVGTALLDAFFKHGFDKGCSVFRLEVVNTNTRAKALYKTLGFETCGQIPFGPIAWRAGFSSQYRMRKPLL